MDPVTGIGVRGRAFGLPSLSKFQSGHLPSTAAAIPKHDADDSGSVSCNPLSTDSEEEEFYGGRYSLDSSPPDDRVSSPNSAAYRYARPSQRRPHYESEYMYSDASSSRETILSKPRLPTRNGRYPPEATAYTEEESSDSAPSTEFSSTQVAAVNTKPVPQVSKGSQLDTESTIGRRGDFSDEVNGEGDDDNDDNGDGDAPTAPPFCNFEINEDDSEQPRNTSCMADPGGAKTTSQTPNNTSNIVDNKNDKTSQQFVTNAAASSKSQPVRTPTFYASAQGPWLAMIAYDACVRLCLHAWAKGCMEAPMFLENECALLRDVFGLRRVLLQSEEELLTKHPSEHVTESVSTKPKNIIGKMKVQVRKVKMTMDPQSGCNFPSLKAPSIKLESLKSTFSNLQSRFSSGRKSIEKTCLPHGPAFSRKGLVHASSQYIKKVSGLLKSSVTTRSSSSSYEDAQETYSCLLRLKSSPEEDAIRLQPGSGETHVFFPGNAGDDLIVEVQDSKAKYYGRVVVQVAAIAEDPGDKLRWWSLYHEPEHELVGKTQLYINYSMSFDENSHLKYGSVAETVAYDLVLESAMKVQHFQQRNLLLHGEWQWLLAEFASYYGVSDSYTKLRYLSYVMDVATPTADCLNLVHKLLLPVLVKGNGSKSTLSRQENRILGEIKDQIEQILALVFENYKSLDESVPSGILDIFRATTGFAAPGLEAAIQLYSLLHDVLSPEAQSSLVHYFQVAVKKRSRKHLAETDEFFNNEGSLMDVVTISTSYQKMKSLCLNIRNEIFTDIEIHNQDILPSFVDLPNLSSSIYSMELCSRLRGFLTACPPSGPSPPVADLVIATANLQRDLAMWNIDPVKGGVDAKELFHLYIMVWIEDKRRFLLESCKLDKVKWLGIRTQHSTTPFVDEMYERLTETLNDYEVIICRWPEYTSVLENAMADIEKAIVEALDKQYANVLLPLKEKLTPKKFGLRYVQKLAKRSVSSYVAPDELGILLNSMKRMLDILRPKVETKLRSWGSCIRDGANAIPGECLSEVTVMLRAKFRNYMQAVVEKLAENSRLHGATKVKKILQDSKQTIVESEVRTRMQPLIEQLTNTVNHLHTVFETHVFVAVCRGYWDRMGQDVLGFLENRKENRSWYRGSRVAVAVLDDAFGSQMQRLLGNALQEKDVEPPRSILEVRSILCKDTHNSKDSTYYC